MNITNASTHRISANRKILAATVLATLFGACNLDASAATSGNPAFATVARTTQLRSGDAVIGALPMSQPIHIEVALKMRDRAGLDAFIADNAKKQAARIAPHLMTSAEFLASHAPTQQQAQTVANYLASMGYKNVAIAPNRLLVSADGTAATARNAFMTTFAQVRTGDGRIAFANTDEVRIPAALQDKILAVVGLQTVHQAQAVAPQLLADGVHTNAIQGHYPSEFASIYGATGTVDASDVNVGIVAMGELNPTLTDLDAYTTNHGLPTVSTVIVHTNGNLHNGNFDTSRSDVDSQVVVGTAGSVRKLFFYDIPVFTHANLTADYNTIVASNDVKIAVASLIECETDAANDGSAAADDAIFATAVAQGQTFAVATGDLGADECPVDPHTGPVPTASWPAASQYVVAVGGTRLDATPTTWNDETAWEASGGSPSTFEPMPSWQSAFGVPGSTRGTPDVAYDANPHTGALVYVNLSLAKVGGTNLSTAIFAGSWARVLQANEGIGFAGPVLYALPATDFHDITSGFNGGESAGIGYDFVSGRGSMIVGSVIAHPNADFTASVSGVTVNFTDTSMDNASTIMTHRWKFGDGSTSTAANPSRTYAVGGTYEVSEKVTDAIGLTSTKTKSVTTGPVNLLQNAGFESATLAPWHTHTQGSDPVPGGFVTCNTPPYIHTGNCAFAMFGDNVQLTQKVTIPSWAKHATFSVNYYIKFPNSNGRGDVDWCITNSQGATSCPAGVSGGNTRNQYAAYSFDLTKYAGQTIELLFKSRNGGPQDIEFFFDDIAITVSQ